MLANKQDTIAVLGGDFVSVIGGVWNDSAGAFFNAGEIHITDSLINDGQNRMFHNSWPGTTILRGGNQIIGGNSVTRFWDLRLTGTGIKRQVINAEVEDSLNLRDRELATDSFRIWCFNPDPGIVDRSTGFVSSLDTGALWRNTNQVANYLFPTGSSLGTTRYRPINLYPNSTNASTFAIRFANLDANLEGFNRANRDSSICEINPNWYHRIRRTAGTTPADIRIWYEPALDGGWDAIAHWQGSPRWENINPTTPSSSPPGWASLVKTMWNNWPLQPFALARYMPISTLSAQADSLCLGDMISLSAAPGSHLNYIWINNGIDTLQQGNSASFSTDTLGPGVHQIHVVSSSAYCDYTSDSIAISVNNQLFTDAGNDTLVCYGDAAMIGGSPVSTGGTGPYSVSWSPAAALSNATINNPVTNILGTTTFIMNVVDAFGCIGQDTVTVNVNPQMYANAGADTLMCVGDFIAIGGTPTGWGGNGNMNYAWSPNINITSLIHANPMVTPTAAQTYYVVVTDGNGCQSMDSISITLDELEPAILQVNGATEFCDGDSVTLSINTPGATNYLWSTGEMGNQITVTQPGTYSVQVAQYCGTAVSQSVNVNVWQVPEAGFTLDPQKQIVNFPVEFTDTSSGPIAIWDWDFGDGNGSGQQHPTHNYTALGTYPVQLIIESPEGCRDTAYWENAVEIILKQTIYFPTAFTPNDDGLNDLFGAIGINIIEFDLEIYNRWGSLVFKSNSINDWWDGTFHGEAAPEDVYTYKVLAKFWTGEEIKQGGSITLLR